MEQVGLHLPNGGGLMGTLIRAKDWSQTALGPVETWPPSLRTALNICLASRSPMLIWWGPELNILRSGKLALVGDLPARIGAPPLGAWPEEPHTQTHAPPRAVRSEGRARSVLVVDDNVDAANLLESHGYMTRVAHDGPQVLEFAQNFVPDVALLDIGLPTMDGYELALRLRTLPSWRNVRMLAVTGYGQSSDRMRSEKAGFDHHLVKPISLAMLQNHLPGMRA
jgi:CheY-like chemotaxis protein